MAVSFAVAVAAATALLLIASPATPATNSGIVNGSFQTCDLTGWSVAPATNGSAGVTGGGFDIGCTGFVSTGSSGPDAAGYIRHDAFWASAGTKITVYAQFGNDCDGFLGVDDYAWVSLDGNAQDVSCNSGWGLYGWTAGYTGYHQFEAGAANDFDTLFSSTLYVDVLKASGLHKV